MNKSFSIKVNQALEGEFITTVKHQFKRGMYVSTFKVDSKIWELMHKGKLAPKSIDQIYAVR